MALTLSVWRTRTKSPPPRVTTRSAATAVATRWRMCCQPDLHCQPNCTASLSCTARPILHRLAYPVLPGYPALPAYTYTAYGCAL
eukprot:scaffold30547_cov63-Phaeocystis_antarctica.AAC.5